MKWIRQHGASAGLAFIMHPAEGYYDILLAEEAPPPTPGAGENTTIEGPTQAELDAAKGPSDPNAFRDPKKRGRSDAALERRAQKAQMRRQYAPPPRGMPPAMSIDQARAFVRGGHQPAPVQAMRPGDWLCPSSASGAVLFLFFVPPSSEPRRETRGAEAAPRDPPRETAAAPRDPTPSARVDVCSPQMQRAQLRAPHVVPRVQPAQRPRGRRSARVDAAAAGPPSKRRQISTSPRRRETFATADLAPSGRRRRGLATTDLAPRGRVE